MLASRAVDLGVEPRSSQTKDYKIGICYFFAKHATLRRKSKDWLAWNLDNVSKWGAMWFTVGGNIENMSLEMIITIYL
jgi:hypothetical protein